MSTIYYSSVHVPVVLWSWDKANSYHTRADGTSWSPPWKWSAKCDLAHRSPPLLFCPSIVNLSSDPVHTTNISSKKTTITTFVFHSQKRGFKQSLGSAYTFVKCFFYYKHIWAQFIVAMHLLRWMRNINDDWNHIFLTKRVFKQKCPQATSMVCNFRISTGIDVGFVVVSWATLIQSASTSSSERLEAIWKVTKEIKSLSCPRTNYSSSTQQSNCLCFCYK